MKEETAAAMAEKCSGMKFAEQQLLRHGWEQGKGLGRGENGISEAIKVKVKCDKGGFGHKESEQFTFHWWDHVFNKASASLAVESGQNGVVVKKTEEKEEGVISNKKPRKAMMDKSALYGRFVKSATLLSGQEQPERSSSSSDDSSSEDDEKLDLSSAKKLSDAELMKACGGRTAHKGARHGLTMSAKLARLEQQEQEFMAKYGKKRQMDKTAQGELISPEPVLHQETVGQTTHKKAKKWYSHEQQNGAQEDLTITGSLENHHNEQSSKKQKKLSKDKPEEAFEDINKVCQTEAKKNHKRSEKKVDECSMLDLASTEPLQQCDEHQQTSSSGSKKKKRRKKKCSERGTMEEEGQNENTLQQSTDTTESAGQEQQEEGSVELQPTCDRTSKRKKKKKKSKHNDSEHPVTEMNSEHRVDGRSAEQSTEAENEAAAVEEERLKSKKRRQCKGVEQEEPLEKKKKGKCKA